MGRFYGSKIKDGEVNTKTGAKWTLEDVPVLWEKKTVNWLETNGYMAG